MKIEMHYRVAYATSSMTYDLSDFGVTEDEWEAMTDWERQTLVEQFGGEPAENPGWYLEYWGEK